MENIDKLRILLQHWIEHNGGHVSEFAKWQATMSEDGRPTVAAAIGEAIIQMDRVSEILTDILNDVGGPKSGNDHHHPHHHD